MIWGYKFLKGRNIFTASNELITTYEDVADLNISSPVLVNGYKIGTVTKIRLNKTDVKKMDVYYLIDGNYKIPKNAVANLKSLGLVDGKGIFLEFDKECSGLDCAVNGDTLTSKISSILDAMLGDSDLNTYGTELSKSVRHVLTNIGMEGEPGAINEIVRQLELTSKNLTQMSNTTNLLLLNSSTNINKTVDNIASITSALAKSNQKIEALLTNLDKITGDIAKSNLQTTISNTNETIVASKEAITQLQATMGTANKALADLGTTISKINNGDGTIAKLMNDKKLYDNFNSTANNLNLLLQDLRLNPKRYAHFSVFGKKQKVYTLPENDPANQENQPNEKNN